MKVVALAVLSIVHVVQGCHIWQAQAHNVGPVAAVRLQHGGRITTRDSCPMSFTIAQVAGPPLALGDPTFYTGTQRTFTFAKRGRYVLQATETMSSAQMGLETLGPDNVLRLVVIVR
jgi:hypothetical protein